MDTDDVIQIVNLAANHSHVFTDSDLITLVEEYLLCSHLDAEQAIELVLHVIENDPRFLSFKDKLDDCRFFIPQKTLINWYISLNMRLARAKIARLDDHHLALLLSTLRVDGTWTSLPSEFLKLGDELSLIKPGLSAGEYVFPIAHVLSFSRQKHEARDFLTNSLRTSAHSILPNGWNTPVEEALASISQKERHILEMRYGLGTNTSMTLEQVGKEFELTRERIRQIEEKGFNRLKHPSRSGNFVVALLSYILSNKGSLIAGVENEPIMSFITEVLGVPMNQVPLTELFFIGQTELSLSELRSISNKLPDLDEAGKTLNDIKNLILSKSDWMMIAGQLSQPLLERRKKIDKVHLVLKQIGKPSHYETIHQAYCMLFPDEKPSVHSIHAILSREEHDIVWIGVRGTFALKEWGYEHPSATIFELITNIVVQRYEETHEPVPISVIQAEVGKHRKVVNRNSILLASFFNPQLDKVGGYSFIPKRVKKEESMGYSIDELDRILQQFEERKSY